MFAILQVGSLPANGGGANGEWRLVGLKVRAKLAL